MEGKAMFTAKPLSVFHLQLRRAFAWLLVALFLAGFFVPAIDRYTGPLLGLWFTGTQQPLRGLVGLLLFTLVPGTISHGGALLHWPGGTLQAAGQLLAAALGVLPFLFHRLLSSRIRGLALTLAFPCAAVSLAIVTASFTATPAQPAGMAAQFFSAWFCSFTLQLWNRTGSPAIRRRVYEVPATLAALAALFTLGQLAHFAPRLFAWFAQPAIAKAPLAGCVLLTAMALLSRGSHQEWSGSALLPNLRSPVSGQPLRCVREHRQEILVSHTGERFTIHNGLPTFVLENDLLGKNRKYNQLYQTIAGFYDDTQRVGSALTAMDRDAYVMSYLAPLEVKPGDLVLETSIGTGLNFQYLPRDIRRVGIDLSEQMLWNCRRNLLRWQMDADLMVANAEHLPFASNTFDSVFHVGGINFFSDRAQAIREMVRVAKPGSLLLIADETEEHVQHAYEHIPYTAEFFKNRTETVSAPIDLLPPDIEQVNLDIVMRGRFYVLSFRKRAAPTIAL
jgi:ubiquinone/menaquinone biosynthesis C-methylase UbiE